MLIALETIRSGGVARSYQLVVPGIGGDVTKSRSRAVVICLHGHYGTGQQFREQMAADRFVESQRIAFAFPDGRRKTWQAGPGNDADANAIDDVVFLSRLADRLRADLRLGLGQVFVCGFSRGAVMAYRFAATTTGKVAGVFGSGATQSVDWSALQPAGWKDSAPRMCHVHGASDPISPAGGGLMPEGYTAWSVAQHEQWWRQRSAAPVLVGTVVGGGHDWYGPGVRPTLPGGVDVGLVLQQPDLTASALEWFGLIS